MPLTSCYVLCCAVLCCAVLSCPVLSCPVLIYLIMHLPLYHLKLRNNIIIKIVVFTKFCAYTATKGEYKKKNARDRAAEKPLIVEPEGMNFFILHDYLSLYVIYIIVLFFSILSFSLSICPCFFFLCYLDYLCVYLNIFLLHCPSVCLLL